MQKLSELLTFHHTEQKYMLTTYPLFLLSLNEVSERVLCTYVHLMGIIVDMAMVVLLAS